MFSVSDAELHSAAFGYVGAGQSADTPEFAVDVIVWWLTHFGRSLYPDAPELLILADGGGSNGYRPHKEMKLLMIEKHDTCPSWNYTIRPRKKGSNL